MQYTPIEIETAEDLGVISKSRAELYEARVTRSLMKKRGINNVRGGDLRETKEYIQLFGYIYDRDEMKAVGYMIVFMITTIVFAIDKFIFGFIPGGV